MRYSTLVLSAASLLISASVLAPVAARAETFSFTVTTTYGVSASGTLSGTPDATLAGVYDITSGSGQINNIAMTLYTPGGTPTNPAMVTFTNPPDMYNANYDYDNLVYTGPGGFLGSSLDLYGLLFSDGGDHTNFFGLGNGAYGFTNDESQPGSFPIDFTLTDTTSVTPEPSSIALLGTGLLGAAGVLRRRRQTI